MNCIIVRDRAHLIKSCNMCLLGACSLTVIPEMLLNLHLSPVEQTSYIAYCIMQHLWYKWQNRLAVPKYSPAPMTCSIKYRQSVARHRSIYTQYLPCFTGVIGVAYKSETNWLVNWLIECWVSVRLSKMSTAFPSSASGYVFLIFFSSFNPFQSEFTFSNLLADNGPS